MLSTDVFRIFVLYYCLNSMAAVQNSSKTAPSWMFDLVLNTPLASLGCIGYLAISMIIATLASGDQVIFEISFYIIYLSMSVLCQA